MAGKSKAAKLPDARAGQYEFTGVEVQEFINFQRAWRRVNDAWTLRSRANSEWVELPDSERGPIDKYQPWIDATSALMSAQVDLQRSSYDVDRTIAELFGQSHLSPL